MKIEIITNDKTLLPSLFKKQHVKKDDSIVLDDSITLQFESETQSLSIEETLITFAVGAATGVFASVMSHRINNWLDNVLGSKKKTGKTYEIKELAVEKDKVVFRVMKIDA